MKILVTGACGGIGSHLVPLLLAQGNEILAIDNLSSGSWDNLAPHSNLSRFTIDISNEDELQDFADSKSFQFVFHLAALSSLPECQVDPRRAFDVNFLGTLNLVKIAKKQSGFKGFVFASTSAVYENNEKSPFSEVDDVNPTLVYPQTKYFAEQYLHSEAITCEFPSVIVRIFNVFGDLQNSTRKSPPILNYIVRELLLGKSPILHGDGRQARDFISVDDVVDFLANQVSMRGKYADIVNLCRGQLLSVNQMFEFTCEALQMDLEPIFAPPNELWVGYPELFMSDFPLNRDFVAREVSKMSLGDDSKLREKYSWRISQELSHQVADIALRMQSRLEMK
jgi:nucleoside-diphosphate-sugar epimerase